MKLKSNVLVSVIMAVYNAETYLLESVNSILEQSLKEFELIVINDVSTDKSLEIIKRLIRKDNRIKLVNLKKRSGPAKARNAGIDLARGKYIAIMDADDISMKRRLEIQYNFLERNKDIFLIGAGAIKIDSLGQKIGNFYPITSRLKLNIKLYFTNCLYHPTIMFRNEEMRYREYFIQSEDYDFYLRVIAKKRKIRNLPYPLIKYRVHKRSKTQSNLKQQKYYKRLALIDFWKKKILLLSNLRDKS